MTAEMRYETASSVQLGLVLSRTTRATSIFMPVNIRLPAMRADTRVRSLPVLRHRPLELPIFPAGGARAGSDGCPEHRRQDALPGTPSRPSLPPFSPRLCQPSSRSGDRIQSLPTQRDGESFRFFPKPRNSDGESQGEVRRPLPAPARGRLGGVAVVCLGRTGREVGARGPQRKFRLRWIRWSAPTREAVLP